MPDGHLYSRPPRRPVKMLRGIPNHETYRNKLVRKWDRKGYQVMFA